MNLSILRNVTDGKFKDVSTGTFMELEIDKVYPNPDQPRKHFTDIEAFAKAIKQDSLLQPIVVVKTDKGFMIISGERRFKAHQLNKATTIKAHIIKADEHKVLELALIENIQREDLTDFEIAKHISKLWATSKYESKTAFALVIGKTPSYLSKAFSCLKLDEEIIKDLEEARKDVPLSVLQELAKVKDEEMQRVVYDKYLNKEITREQIEPYRNLTPVEVQKIKSSLNTTLTFSKNVWVGECFKTLGLDWLLEKFNEEEFYKLNIKQVQNYTNEIDDTKGKIVFVLDTTQKVKDAIKDVGSEWKEVSSSMKIGEYYKVTITPTGIKLKKQFKEEKKTSKEAKDEIHPDQSVIKFDDETEKPKQDHSKLIANAQKYRKEFDHNKKEEEASLLNSDHLTSLAFTTQNQHGTFVCCNKGDFEGVLKIEEGQELIETCGNHNYKVQLVKISKTAQPQNGVWDTPAEESMANTIKEMRQEIDELQRKELYIISYAHKRGHPHGGGYRVRAFNRDEALELGREHYNAIDLRDADRPDTERTDREFFARTLKEIEYSKATNKKTLIAKVTQDNQGYWFNGNFIETFFLGSIEDGKQYKIIIEEM